MYGTVAPATPYGAYPPASAAAAISPQAFQQLESKLDAIQANLSRALGTGSAFDPNPTLNGAQMLKAFNALLTERDNFKTQTETQAEKITELQSKISQLHERNEK